MSVSITLDNVENGEELLPPCDVSGSASSTVGNITAIAWQVNDGELQDVSPTAPASPTSFAFTVRESDCPPEAPWHLVTVFAWDDQGNSSSETRTFSLIVEQQDTADQIN